MRIIRPYGSSRSRPKDGGLRRVLIDNTAKRAEHDIPEFAATDDELVIAQWISTIDKIARKPKGNKKPSPVQRSFREKLGNVCWLRLTGGGHLPGAAGGRRQHLSDLWWFKIHPYGKETEEPRLKDGKLPQWAEVKGRWYARFAGDGTPENAGPPQVEDIAARIERHLYGDEAQGRKGRIAARAESIEGNVLRPPRAAKARDNQPPWSEKDVATYIAPGDPAAAIRAEAEALEPGNERINLPAAAKVLFDHWGHVFKDAATGRPLKRTEVEANHLEMHGMLALHDELKQCYRHLLKRARKDTGAHRREAEREGRAQRKLSTLLPRDLKDALRLADLQDTNAELAALVRLGKVIHYTASDGGADRTRTIRENWPQPDAVANSRFWQSEGQAEIKRAEAFVRIWRQALVLARLTLTDWVSKAPLNRDVFEGNQKKLDEILDPTKFDRTHFKGKLRLLFGNRSGLFDIKTDAGCLGLLRGLIDGAASLRHAAFHFKGRGQLLDELVTLRGNFPDPVKQTAALLWEEDVKGRTAQLKKDLAGAHVEEFLTQEQAARVFALVAGDAVAELPLPRFSRVLERRKHAWEDAIRLPEPANLRALEVPWRHCQYAVLKLVYERPFRAWLKEQKADAISRWIERAVERATARVKAKYAKGDEVAEKVIAARAAGLPKPTADGKIVEFFFDLSRETASEMRVQRAYEHDAEKAREQAEYIENLLRDVTILAFDAYLAQAQLQWLLDIAPDRRATCSLAGLPEPQPALAAESWQAPLYLILHLLPVESVGQLLHQLFRWKVGAGRDIAWTEKDNDRLQRLFATMTLYLDMHDAKFEGGEPLAGCEEFAVFFKGPKGFASLCSAVLDEKTKERIPQRGLREIMRFGHLPVLKVIGAAERIDDALVAQVSRLETAPAGGGESQIAQMQKRREELHDQWVKAKDAETGEKQPDAERPPRFGIAEVREYCGVLRDIGSHRELANFVYLIDHVRDYRMTMAVFARLVEYAGLFERDLYFVTLALLQRKGMRPEDFFAVSDDEKKNGLKKFDNGEIIAALRLHKKNDQAVAAVLNELGRHFTDVWVYGNALVEIRNALMHLNMLQGDNPAPQLTHWVNQTRRLMAYDRKLKNAVSKSVIELLAREGIDLRCTMKIDGAAHDLADAELSSRCAEHLGSQKLKFNGADRKDRGVPIKERLHGEGCVAMLAAAFAGTPRPTDSIIEDLERVDWAASSEKKRPRRDSRASPPERPPSGKRDIAKPLDEGTRPH